MTTPSPVRPPLGAASTQVLVPRPDHPPALRAGSRQAQPVLGTSTLAFAVGRTAVGRRGPQVHGE